MTQNLKRTITDLPLSELTKEEWESLCDGCGQCCLVKLEDEDTGEFHYTDVVCQLFDQVSCQCSDYENRHHRMPDCVALTLKTVAQTRWLPKTCAYRLRAEGKPLFDWHPLICGNAETLKNSPHSVHNKIFCSEEAIEEDELLTRITDRFSC